MTLPFPSPLAAHWTLDPAVTFLNHGSFGACPRAILEMQGELRARMESEPVRFLTRELPDLLDASRERVVHHAGCAPDDLAFVPNATAGVNAVLGSLALRPGDELLTTDHAYNACANVLRLAAERAGARVVFAHVPFPLESEDQAVQAVLDAVTPRTRLALIDWITSPTALVLPVERLIRELEARGVDVLLDGAHAPGQVPLRLGELRPAWCAANLHKWMCAPKGAGFLYAREDRREGLRPVITSHGENTRRAGRSAFHDRFDWPGTLDPTAWICAGAATDWCAGLFPGGLAEWMERGHALALEARQLLCDAWNIQAPCPETMIGAMATLPAPVAARWELPTSERIPPQQTHLLERYGIEVPIFRWGEPRRDWIRVSAAPYNSLPQYAHLRDALAAD